MEQLVIADYIEQTRIFATKTMAKSFSDKFLYHDVTYVRRVVEGVKLIMATENLEQSDKEHLVIAGWLSLLGLKNFDKMKSNGNPKSFFASCNECSIDLASMFLNQINYPAEGKGIILELVKNTSPESNPKNLKEEILNDALSIDWGKPKGKKHIKNLYLELLLTDNLNVGTANWLAAAIEFLNGHTYYTKYAKENFNSVKDSLILKLEKELKEFGKTEKLAIKQELGISDDELKALKKSLKSVRGRDERGIQTLFRNTSKNHYTLNKMVDRKANIFISINAIILSLIIGKAVGEIDTWCIHNSPLLIILISSVTSIVFAVVSIFPTKTHGSFSEEEVRNKKGNLLYFGNYHNMAYRDYEWGILQMLNDSDYLYSSMIKDQYFLGKQLAVKHRLLRLALVSFILGFVISAIIFLTVSSMPGYHVGNGVH